MANFVYNNVKDLAGEAGNVVFATDDIRAALVMTNTTADTEDDVLLMNAFSTLDECDDSTYARVALTSEAWAKDATNNRSEFDAADTAFSSLTGDSTRQIAGVLIYKHVTNDTDSIPIAYIDTVSGGTTFPFTLNAGTLTIQWNAEGIVQFG